MPNRRRVRLNDRDVHLLETLGEYGVLDLELCRQLCFAKFSTEWCRQVVSRLCEVGLIRSAALEVWHDKSSRRGRIPRLLFLSPAGADMVRYRTGQSPRRVLRSAPSPLTIYHRLQVVKFRVAFDEAARTAGLSSPQWIMEQDHFPSPRTPTAMPQRRRVLSHEFRDSNDRVLTCRPDAAFLVAIPHPNGDASQATMFAAHLEIDRSTEGIAQCERKLPGYALLHQQRAWTRYWPELRNSVHRTLWIVPSAQRITTLSDAFKDVPFAENFRFADVADCAPDRILTSPVWRDCRGQTMTLYRSTGTPKPVDPTSPVAVLAKADRATKSLG